MQFVLVVPLIHFLILLCHAHCSQCIHLSMKERASYLGVASTSHSVIGRVGQGVQVVLSLSISTLISIA